MHVYNAIIVLKEILPVFPLATVAPDTGPAINTAVDQLLEKEERGDLKILGKAYVLRWYIPGVKLTLFSYSASLKKREHYWAISKTAQKVNRSMLPYVGLL
jgi:THO complex subunit 2